MAKALPRNAEIADQLDLLADISEILAEESFKVIAYRRAATRIRETPGPVAELALAGRATALPGIGKTIEQKVVEIATDGEMHALTRRREKVPAGVVDFLRLPGVGPKTAARIWTELGITTLDGLKTAAQDGRLRGLSGMGQKSEEKILVALAAGAGRKAPRDDRGLLGRALPAVHDIVEQLSAHSAAIAVSEAGSVRRRRETVRDLDFIATSAEPRSLIAAFCEADWVSEVVARGATKATVVGHQGLRFDLRVVPPECFGNVLQHFTGSKDHNVALREDAQRRGLSISEYGVATVETGEVVTHASEEELYEYLGYDWIPPELRESDGELAAARDHALPALVELSDLRGEILCQSTWSSDGMCSVEEMAMERIHQYGVVGMGKAKGKTFTITSMVEKPPREKAPSTLIITGRYILQPEIFNILATQQGGAGGEIQITDAMIELAKQQPFYGLKFKGRSFDCGSKVGFLTANVAYALARDDIAPAFRKELSGLLGTK